MINGLIAPHGGELVINMAGEKERAALQERALSLPQVLVGSRQLADLEMLAIGAYSPLGGFMNQADYLGSVKDMHLSHGLPWSVPITLSVTSEQAASFKEGLHCQLSVHPFSVTPDVCGAWLEAGGGLPDSQSCASCA